MALKTDYKDEVLSSSQPYRTYNIVDSGGSTLYSGVRINRADTPQQEGSKFGASDINAITKAVNGIVDLVYPVGTVYETMDIEFDPNVTWGGTWVKTGEGKFPVGYDPDDPDFSTVGKTGGSKDNTHNHYQSMGYDYNANVTYITASSLMPRSKVTTGYRGEVKPSSKNDGTTRVDSTENETISIVPPYEVRIYWKRTA